MFSAPRVLAYAGLVVAIEVARRPDGHSCLQMLPFILSQVKPAAQSSLVLQPSLHGSVCGSQV